MVNASYEMKEVRFVVEPELLQVYVHIVGHGDCPIGVTGWHHKTYPASMTCLEVLEHWKGNDPEHDPVLWPLNTPA